MKTQINAYLNFNGRCREAMTFYQQCIGGELVLQKVSESPMAAQMPSEMGAQILHSTLTKGSILLMASDMMGSSLLQGNNITLLFNCGNEKDIHEYFNHLSVDGHVKLPVHQSFWGSLYGELTDKFGMNWSFNCTK